MAKPRKIGNRYKFSLEKGIEAYVLSETTDLSNDKIGKKYGVSGNTISNWKRKIKEDPTAFATAQLEVESKKSKRTLSKRRPFDEDLAIQAYVLRQTTDKTQEEIAREVGISKTSVYRWTDAVKNNTTLRTKAKELIKKTNKRTPAKLPIKKKKHNGLKKSFRFTISSQEDMESIQELMKANEFLRWWNLGLQEGFVDRLLEEMKR